jgi:hypothetical protein
LKNSKLTERFNLQFRVEAFDVFNHPDYTLGNLSVFQTTANALNQGYANLTSVPTGGFLNEKNFNGGSRQVQLGVKLTF